MNHSIDGQIDQLVKARWLALGLSQADLAEILGIASQREQITAGKSRAVDADRLAWIAEALGVSASLLDHRASGTRGGKRDPSVGMPDSEQLQSLLELRMLRVFRRLQNPDVKRVLIGLTEQIVKRGPHAGDAG